MMMMMMMMMKISDHKDMGSYSDNLPSLSRQTGPRSFCSGGFADVGSFIPTLFLVGVVGFVGTMACVESASAAGCRKCGLKNRTHVELQEVSWKGMARHGKHGKTW